jgi:hypothetical protein
MTDELRNGMDLEGSRRRLIPAFSRRDWWKSQKTSDMIAGVLAKIQTENLPSMHLTRYCYDSPYGDTGHDISLIVRPFNSWNDRERTPGFDEDIQKNVEHLSNLRFESTC